MTNKQKTMNLAYGKNQQKHPPCKKNHMPRELVSFTRYQPILLSWIEYNTTNSHQPIVRGKNAYRYVGWGKNSHQECRSGLNITQRTLISHKVKQVKKSSHQESWSPSPGIGQSTGHHAANHQTDEVKAAA